MRLPNGRSLSSRRRCEDAGETSGSEEEDEMKYWVSINGERGEDDGFVVAAESAEEACHIACWRYVATLEPGSAPGDVIHITVDTPDGPYSRTWRDGQWRLW